jgi:hypothetical protein
MHPGAGGDGAAHVSGQGGRTRRVCVARLGRARDRTVDRRGRHHAAAARNRSLTARCHRSHCIGLLLHGRRHGHARRRRVPRRRRRPPRGRQVKVVHAANGVHSIAGLNRATEAVRGRAGVHPVGGRVPVACPAYMHGGPGESTRVVVGVTPASHQRSARTACARTVVRRACGGRTGGHRGSVTHGVGRVLEVVVVAIDKVMRGIFWSWSAPGMPDGGSLQEHLLAVAKGLAAFCASRASRVEVVVVAGLE